MSRWKRLLHLGRVDDLVDWEIGHHIDERIDELMAAGRSRAEAEREARRAFGDLAHVRAAMRAESVGGVRREQLRLGLRGLWQDVAQAVKRLRRRPAFALVAIVILGLGIGANTAVLTVLDAALLERPPYPEPERLVMLDLVREDGGERATMPWSYPKFDFARDRLRSFESVAGYWPSTLTLTGAGQARRLDVEFISPGYLELLGVRPIRGRAFGPDQDDAAGSAAVLVGEGLWRSLFGADPDLLGRAITLDGAALVVIGIVPSSFRGVSGGAEIWVPFAGITTIRGPRRLQNRSGYWLHAIGRLRPDATIEQARAEAAAAGAALVEAFPPAGDWEPRAMGVEPLLDARVNPVTRLAVSVVSIGAALLLLVACANVAGLLLVRASARRTELAVRAALGAGRARLARESLVETMLLALAGGALGAGIAFAGQRWVAGAVRFALDTSGSRRLQFLDPAAISVDMRIVAAGVLAAVVTCLVFGLLPALAASRPGITAGLYGGGRDAVAGARDHSAAGRAVLVAGQLALTMVLLCGAGLMAVSFARLSQVAVGFGNDDVLAVAFNRGANTTPAEDAIFETMLLERAAAMPGVRSAAVAPCPPLTAPCEIVGILQIDGTLVEGDGEGAASIAYAVSDDYFSALGIPVRMGRAFTAGDAAGTPPVAVISESAAALWFPGRPALGHRLAFTHVLASETPTVVVGVVADVQYGTLDAPMLPAIYLSRRQAPSSYGTLLLHTDGNPYRVLDGVRAAALALDPDIPLYDIRTMSELRAAATGRTRVLLGLLGSFALLGLVLSSTGLYGIVSYAVVRRTPEMGVRMALGASTRDVLRLVMISPAVLAAVGAATGVVAALALTRHVEELLFGVASADPRVLGAATIAMLTVAAAAAYVPARRALGVSPASALRAE